MTMQPSADTAELERADSAEGADLQDGEQQPEQQQPTLADYVRAAVREENEQSNRRIQSWLDKTTNTVTQLQQKFEALERRGIDASALGEQIEELRDELRGDPDAAERRKLERKLAKAEREVEQAQQPKPEAPQSADDATYELRFYNEVAPDLDAYGRLRGFSDEEMAAANWMQRLAAQGAPSDLDMSDPRSIRAYKEGMRKAVDALAQAKRAQTRPRTSTPNMPTNGGSGNVTWDQAQKIKNVNDLSDDAYEKLVARK